MFKILLPISLLSATLLADSVEDFFYKRGYESGYNAGYTQGVKRAYEDAKNVLLKYGNELKAYEVGKYLVRTQNLTYPKVYQERGENGSFKLIITPSEIQKELNIDELFAKFGKLPTIEPSALENAELSLDEKNSVNLSLRDSNINDLPQNVSTDSAIKTLNIEKTSKNLEILKKANVVFSDENERYNVLFFTEQEKKDFCKQFKICK